MSLEMILWLFNVIGYDSSIEFILLLISALFSIRRIIRYAIQISKNIPNTGFCRGFVSINTCTGVFYQQSDSILSTFNLQDLYKPVDRVRKIRIKNHNSNSEINMKFVQFMMLIAGTSQQVVEARNLKSRRSSTDPTLTDICSKCAMIQVHNVGDASIQKICNVISKSKKCKRKSFSLL